jgi:16S rRNA C1402 N4-methylase RsmH
VKSVDGIWLIWFLHQFDVERGFSTRFDAELDMSQKNDLNANRVVNEYDEANLKECSWIMEIEKCSCIGENNCRVARTATNYNNR